MVSEVKQGGAGGTLATPAPVAKWMIVRRGEEQKNLKKKKKKKRSLNITQEDL